MRNTVVFGFDFGLKKIGIAVGQSVTRTATPLATLQAQDGAPHWNEIQALVDEWQPDKFLVGAPLHMDGSEQSLTKAAMRFGNRLKGRFNIPVEWVDERLTSFEAEKILSGLKISSRNVKISVDSLAAQLIVEQWFTQQVT